MEYQIPTTTRIVIADEAQVAALPVLAFQMFMTASLPPIIRLRATAQVQDAQGRDFTLLLMA